MVNPTGCCNIDHSIRFDCSSCAPSMCCAVYEHCVSCCLSSDKKPVLQDILTNSIHPVYSSVKDQFELCLAKCRTSSQSVHHENSYRNPDTKYCYGPPHDKQIIRILFSKS
uniref:SREBP regulating gene protein n=1 Tax=Amphimedon queenslandica TaxID=400682 RepID=A0A1X7TNY7_AMPQE